MNHDSDSVIRIKVQIMKLWWKIHQSTEDNYFVAGWNWGKRGWIQRTHGIHTVQWIHGIQRGNAALNGHERTKKARPYDCMPGVVVRRGGADWAIAGPLPRYFLACISASNAANVSAEMPPLAMARLTRSTFRCSDSSFLPVSEYARTWPRSAVESFASSSLLKSRSTRCSRIHVFAHASSSTFDSFALSNVKLTSNVCSISVALRFNARRFVIPPTSLMFAFVTSMVNVPSTYETPNGSNPLTSFTLFTSLVLVLVLFTLFVSIVALHWYYAVRSFDTMLNRQRKRMIHNTRRCETCNHKMHDRYISNECFSAHVRTLEVVIQTYV